MLLSQQPDNTHGIYLAVPYTDRHEAKALGARWDAVKKAWYVGPEADREKIAKWELKHQPLPTLDPRAEFAAVLREIGGIVDGNHPIMNGEPQRIPTHDDKPGERTIFYVAHSHGVASGYAENNRTKEVVRWKVTVQHLSQEAKAALLAQAEQQRYARRQAEREMHEATAKRLSEELRGLSSGVETTAYHKAKLIEAMPGAPVRNGDVLVPGYDPEGKLWTIQYIKADGTKRFAKESRKNGCFHVVGAANPAALQKIGLSPVVVIAEGYATAASIAMHAKFTAIAAFDSGNLLAVASSIHERYKDKQIIIAGDDDHGRENNPGRTKALEAAAAVKGLAVFPQLSPEQREKGLTDFNDLAQEDPRLAKHQLEEAVRRSRQRDDEQTAEIGRGLVRLEKCLLPGGRQGKEGEEIYVPKDAVGRVVEQSMKIER